MAGSLAEEMREYIRRHDLAGTVNRTLTVALRDKPDDVFNTLSLLMKKKAVPENSGIVAVRARSCLDAQCRATIEATVRTRAGPFRASVSSGACYLPRPPTRPSTVLPS